MKKYHIDDPFEHRFWIDADTNKVWLNGDTLCKAMEFDNLDEAKDRLLGIWDEMHKKACEAIEDAFIEAYSDTNEPPNENEQE